MQNINWNIICTGLADLQDEKMVFFLFYFLFKCTHIFSSNCRAISYSPFSRAYYIIYHMYAFYSFFTYRAKQISLFFFFMIYFVTFAFAYTYHPCNAERSRCNILNFAIYVCIRSAAQNKRINRTKCARNINNLYNIYMLKSRGARTNRR